MGKFSWNMSHDGAHNILATPAPSLLSPRQISEKRRRQPDIVPVKPLSNCTIHVLDVSKTLAPAVGVSKCNMKTAWPLDKNTVQKMVSWDRPLPLQWADHHAIGYWVKEAILKSSFHTPQIDKADLVLADT